MKDIRYQKTKEIIEEKFLSLLKTKELSKITVSEITKSCRLSRGAFYLHYKDIYDLYDKFEKELFLGLVDIFDSAFPTTEPKNSENLTYSLTKYVTDNKDAFLTLINNKNTNTLQNVKILFNKRVNKENNLIHQNSDSKFNYIEAVFTVSGVVGVLEEWILDGLKEEPHEIAKALNKILIKINTQ